MRGRRPPGASATIRARATCFARRPTVTRSRTALFAFAFAAAACRSPGSAPAEACEPEPCPVEVALSGRLHGVWNGTVRWYLVDVEGSSTDLVIGDTLAFGPGGAATLDRRLVRVRGLRLGDGSVRVSSLEPDSVGGG